MLRYFQTSDCQIKYIINISRNFFKVIKRFCSEDFSYSNLKIYLSPNKYQSEFIIPARIIFSKTGTIDQETIDIREIRS